MHSVLVAGSVAGGVESQIEFTHLSTISVHTAFNNLVMTMYLSLDLLDSLL